MKGKIEGSNAYEKNIFQYVKGQSKIKLNLQVLSSIFVVPE